MRRCIIREAQMKVALIMYGLVMIAAIVCFTIVAIHFNHWWIILFSYFFMFSYHSDDKDDTDED